LVDQILIERGYSLFNAPRNTITFVSDREANELVNNIEDYPHAFVLACLMDRQLKAERAWGIPFRVKEIIGGFEFSTLQKVSLDNWRQIFNEYNLHRFNEEMAKVFYKGIQKIANDYGGNASNIWKGRPGSAAVVYRFLEFYGAGQKIATMAANILAREFKVKMSDYYSIDISIDVHVTRVFKRSGLVPQDASPELLIYKARELNPEYPGVFDLSCWEIGRNWCKEGKEPECNNCILYQFCPKKI